MKNIIATLFWELPLFINRGVFETHETKWYRFYTNLYFVVLERSHFYCNYIHGKYWRQFRYYCREYLLLLDSLVYKFSYLDFHISVLSFFGSSNR